MRIAAVVLSALIVTGLPGCSASTAGDSCELIGDNIDRAVVAVAQVVHDSEATPAEYADAAAEVQALIPVLSEVQLSEAHEGSRTRLVEGMTELGHALNEQNPEWSVTLAADLQAEWVDLSEVCAHQ